MANRWVVQNLTTTDKITELYVATLDRAPDKEGLAYWVNQVNTGALTIAQVAGSFFAQPETQARYPAGTTNGSFVIAVYNNALGRAPDSAGLAYWTAELDAGRTTRADFILAFLQGAYDDPAATPPSFDASLLTNQHIAAEYFAGVDSNGATVNPDAKLYPWAGTPTEQANFLLNAAGILAPVTADASTIALSKALSDAFETGGGVVGSGQTFTLTAAVDNIPGLIGSLGTTVNTGDDIIIAGEGSVGGQHTLGSSDVINAGTGTDRINIRLADTAAAPVAGQVVIPNMISVEKVYTQAITSAVAAGNRINAINVTGTTEWWSDNSTSTLVVDNVKEKAAVGVIGGNAAAPQDYQVGFAAAAVTGSLSVALSGAVLDDLGVSSQAGTAEFATWDFNVTGAANSTIATLTNNGVGIAGAGVALKSLTTVNVVGDKQLTITDELTGVTTINSSTETAATAGVRVKIDTLKDVTFTGGAGADRVDVQAAGLNLNDKLDGGAGTDTFRIANGVMLTTALAGNVKAFEIFEGMGAAQTYDLDALLPNNTLTEVRLNPTNLANITVNNIPSTATATIRAVQDEIGTATLTAKNFIQGGTTDTATLILDNSITGVTKFATGVDIAVLDFARVDNLNIKSVSDGTPADAETNSIAALTAGDLEVITITGDQGVLLTTTATSNAVTKVDASGLTGAAGLTLLTLNLSADTAGEGAEIIGTAQKDVITSTAVAIAGKGDNITAGAGSDIITLSLTGGVARNNTLNYTAATIGTGDLAADTQDTINGIAVGDRINMTAGVEAQLKVNGLLLSATAANQTLTAAAFDINNNIIAVDKGADRAIQIDLNGDGLFTSTLDFEILLAGRAGSTVVYDATNDYFTLPAVVVGGAVVPLTAGGTFTGTAGIDNNFTGAVGTLSGTKITGTATDNEILTITGATGGVALNNGTTGGTITNVKTLTLDNVANTFTFGAAGSGIMNINGGSDIETINLHWLAPGGQVKTNGGADVVTLDENLAGTTVDLGAGADTFKTTAGGAITTTLIGGADADTLVLLTADDLSGASVTGFETLTITKGATVTFGANSLLTQFTAIDATANAGNETVNITAGSHNITGAVLGANFNDAGQTATFAISTGASLTVGGDAQLTAATALFTGAGTLVTTAGLTLAGATDTIANVTFGAAGLTITDDGAAARAYTGSTGADILVTGNAIAAISVNISQAGADTIKVDAAGTATAAGLVSITGFQAGAAADADILDLNTAGIGANDTAFTVAGGNISAGNTIAVGNIANLYHLGGAAFQVAAGSLTATGDGAAVEQAILAAGLVTGALGTGNVYITLDDGVSTGVYRLAYADSADADVTLSLAGEFAVVQVATLIGVADNTTLVNANII